MLLSKTINHLNSTNLSYTDMDEFNLDPLCAHSGRTIPADSAKHAIETPTPHLCFTMQSTYPDLDKDHTLQQRIFLESQNFVAAASLGPVLPGHTIVIPRKFYWNLHDSCPSTDLQIELVDLVNQSKQLLKSTYDSSQALCFEHGLQSWRSPQDRCGTIYPHLHVVPTDASIWDTFESVSASSYTFADISNFYSRSRWPSEYVSYFEADRGVVLYRGKNHKFPGNFVRNYLEHKLQLPPTKWCHDIKLELALQTAELLRNRVQK